MSDPAPPVTGQQLAERAATALFGRDRASQALGMRLTGMQPGGARVALRVRADMVNGHGVCHGGIAFAPPVCACACASNSSSGSSFAAAATIDSLLAAREGAELTAAASELWRTRRNGL